MDHASRGGGIGKKLYQALEKKLKFQGIQNINACISVPATNEAHVDYASMHFHEHLGYRLVGTVFIAVATNLILGMIWSGWRSLSGPIQYRHHR